MGLRKYILISFNFEKERSAEQLVTIKHKKIHSSWGPPAAWGPRQCLFFLPVDPALPMMSSGTACPTSHQIQLPCSEHNPKTN